MKITLAILLILAQVPGFAAELADRAEVKMNLSLQNIAHSLKALKYDRDEAQVRKIYFLDSQDLGLYGQNIVLRIRLSNSDNSDVTLKQRPANSKFDWSDYRQEADFKCEADITGTKKVTGCSLSEDISDKDAEVLVSKEVSLKDALGPAQEKLLNDLDVSLQWNKIKVLGPITSTKWKFKHNGIKVDVEMWNLNSGEVFLEISSKGRLSEIATMKEILQSLVSDFLLQEEPLTISKTEFALKKLTNKKN